MVFYRFDIYLDNKANIKAPVLKQHSDMLPMGGEYFEEEVHFVEEDEFPDAKFRTTEIRNASPD